MKRRITCHGVLIATLLLATISATVTMASTDRFKLGQLYPQERIEKVLIPRDQWRPYPAWQDRAAWEALPAEVREDLVSNGIDYSAYEWPALPATLFLEYARVGNRSHYEKQHFARRVALTDLVLAECVDGKGRFLDDIVNGIWAICEESFWGLPAHVGAQKAGSGLPDTDEPIVALFVAETAETLAWTSYLLGEQLDTVSPLVRKRIATEIDRRVLTPCLERDDFWWLGNAGREVNNWNPWCNASWLTATLLIEPDENRRARSVAKIVRSLDSFLDVYGDDGGCDEGPGYWGRAGASLFDCLDLLQSASGGKIDVFDRPLIQEIGRYIYRVHIADKYFVNFADAPARVGIPSMLVYRYGKGIGDERLMSFGALGFARSGGMASAFEGQRQYTMGRALASVFNAEEINTAKARPPLVRDAWLSGIQVMTTRDRAGSTEGLYVAAKGGHNAESHNHNDVGNFIVYANGRPMIVDIGVETYSRKTFSSQRYEIWTMQSAYHSLPTIDGVMQAPGRRFAAKDVSYHNDDASAQLKLDIAGAYPEEAKLKSWVRTITLNRGRDITVVEDYELTEPAEEITLSLMTPCRATLTGPGIILQDNDGLTNVQIEYDQDKLSARVEPITIEDSRLRSSWPRIMRRITLRADKPALKDKWSLRIELMKDN